ncbi:type III-B CRISPR module RAMP protein Cmr4 [Gandjariella thermophila]|uniref:Type III-B CRISPR module RAMP protein Cmr4 n=1 Tax=Gandjariella thermophila TaxID=1931992 RepID=A0A4D4J3L5_9PSEU|nr:type III-B CRISPR module RAMP protein Cmr4 [Gandjariella thermophila]GDY29086.1 type III-B CRISPR module RAMP protein Cmr4 [Gandjariella thermophila]
MERRLLVLFAETPVHAGGSEALGAVDLPVQREAGTNLPVIWGQSLKGALRQAARDDGWTVDDQKAVFGSPPPGYPGSDGEADDGSGSRMLVKGTVSIGDAQLLLFPAAALRRGFAWVTSDLALNRLWRKAILAGSRRGDAFRPPARRDAALGTGDWAGTQVVGAFQQNVTADDAMGRIGRVFGSLACPTDAAFDYTRSKLAEDVILAGDDLLKDLGETGTDVVARVQLDDDKAVANGPFYSEYLPVETVLAALLAGPAGQLDRLSELLDGKPLQLGGNETIGKGLLWCRVHRGADLDHAVSAADQPTAAAPQPVPATAPRSRDDTSPNPQPSTGAARPNPGLLAQQKRQK